MLSVFIDYSLLITLCVFLTFIYYSLLSVLWSMLPVFPDYSLLITLGVLSNVYLLQCVQCVVANVTCDPRLLIIDYPLCFV